MFPTSSEYESFEPTNPQPEETITRAFMERYEFSPMSKNEVAGVLDELINSGRLNEIGEEYYTTVKEALWLVDEKHPIVASSILEAADYISKLKGISAYMIGAFEAGWHHFIITGSLSVDGADNIIMGLETPYYKNRLFPDFDPEDVMRFKMSFWQYLCPSGLIFRIPPRPDSIDPNFYYDALAVVLGVFKHPKVVYVGAPDDPQELIDARERRAAHALSRRIWSFTHVSNLLK